MSANFTPTQTAIADLRPFRMWCQKVLPAIYDESLSYYELLCKVVNYINQNIDDINTLNDNVTNIYNAYVLLQNYVNDYFESEAPQMISDKLDELVEDGTLSALIAEYVDPYFDEKSNELDQFMDNKTTQINNAISEQNATIETNTNTLNSAISSQNTAITNLENRMSTFITSNSGLAGETTLFDLSNMTYKWSGVGTELVFDYDPSGFLYVDFHWYHKGRLLINRFPASVVSEVGTGVELHDTYINGTTIEHARIKVTRMAVGTQNYELSVCQLLDGNGTSTNIQDATEGNTQQTYILKAVGIRNVPNTEVTDARVGADGTVYPTLEDRLNAENSELKSQIAQLEAIPTAVKHAMDTLFQNVAFKNDDVYTDEIAVVHNWATAVNLVSISAVFDQGSNAIYDTDSLETLRQYLTVTANYDDGTSTTVTTYTLSGTLEGGTSSITVTYEEKTASFNVNVIGATFVYTPSDGLLSAQSYISFTPPSSNVVEESISDGKYVANVPKATGWGNNKLLFVPNVYASKARLIANFNIEQCGGLSTSNTSSLGYIMFTLGNGTNGGAVGFARKSTGSLYTRYSYGSTASYGKKVDFNTDYELELIVENGVQTAKLNGEVLFEGQPLSSITLAQNSMFGIFSSNNDNKQTVSITRIAYYTDGE